MDRFQSEKSVPVGEVDTNSIGSFSMRLYEITNNNGTKLVVSDFGATVMSLCIHDRNNQLRDIALGYENKNQYYDDEFYLGSLIGRYANRISGDTIVLDGISYKIPVREGGYHLHGGVAGFNKKKFSIKQFRNEHDSGLILKYSSPHLEEGFPGKLDLEVVYTLDDDNNWIVEYSARTDRTTAVNFTQHCYFNLTGEPSTNIENHEIRINSDLYLPVNKMQVPTGVCEHVRNTPFDFTTFRKIGTQINEDHEQLLLGAGYDHSWILQMAHTQNLKYAASVREATTGINLDVFTTEPAIHFYSGNYLKEMKSKYQTVFHKRSGFCLETQHFPDTPNHPDFPTTVLKADELFYSKTVFKLSVSKNA